MSTDELEVLLIEDNPGDARLIEEMFGEAGSLHQRVGSASAADGSRIRHETTLSDGLDRLSDGDGDVDVLLLDLGLPDSTGLETLERVLDATEFVPTVVLTGLRDEEAGIEAVERGAQDYLVKDEVTSDLLVRSVHHAIERNRQERERARQLEQLEALNRLNRISQDVTHAVITTDTREDLEQAVCDRFVESDGYRFAWIGGLNRSTETVTPRVSAGVEAGYLDEVTISLDDGADTEGPGARAVRTRSVQVVQDVQTDPDFERWRDRAAARGFQSVAAVPIAHGDLFYGLLGVYADSPNAFTEPEAEVLARLGEVIGHAITAVDRRDALASEAVLELEFGVTGVATELAALTADGESAVEVESVVRSDEGVVAYGRVDGVAREAFGDAARQVDVVDDFRLLSMGDDEYEFELTTDAANSLVSAIATHGGRLSRATLEDGEFRFVTEFPRGRERRQLIELVEEHCPTAEPRAQRTVQRDDSGVDSAAAVVENRLTEKQHAAVETAVFAGFFDWPRTSTGEEVADRLGVSAATFTQHLRAAERKLFEALFREEADDDASAGWTSLEPDPGTDSDSDSDADSESEPDPDPDADSESESD
ncbi:bacterio-opsin activator domain-containing protein [Halosimplex salinum]|uniref:bacterio-opsin activator domain-containing protein n=1 Tax=Halosimplex salinum TaxID=1710538 RepID=UPI000F48E8DC|nr:bacterio-opsin activator domain-containing protein [Halosimplex salinum]